MATVVNRRRQRSSGKWHRRVGQRDGEQCLRIESDGAAATTHCSLVMSERAGHESRPNRTGGVRSQGATRLDFGERLQWRSRGVAQPGSAPALGEDDRSPTPSVAFDAFLTFSSIRGNLLSLETEPKPGQNDRVLRQFRDRNAGALERPWSADAGALTHLLETQLR